MYLVDTSVWIEIFQETPKGKQVVIKLFNVSLFTASASIAEISKWCHLNKIDVAQKISRIEISSEIVHTTRFSEELAGELWVQVNKSTGKKVKQVGLIDCIIAAIAEENGLTVLTKDKHFEKFDKIKKELI
ncbi:MAG: PIN domain-containing protein [Candidatus Diapherotrites archaeon]|nr:PIN domain-containing protein [Candidatus Diapherotrites archaeon]